MSLGEGIFWPPPFMVDYFSVVDDDLALGGGEDKNRRESPRSFYRGSSGCSKLSHQSLVPFQILPRTPEQQPTKLHHTDSAQMPYLPLQLTRKTHIPSAKERFEFRLIINVSRPLFESRSKITVAAGIKESLSALC